MVNPMKMIPTLKIRYLGIDTYKEPVIYMREDCHVCRAEGIEVQTRVKVSSGKKSIIATVNTVKSDLLSQGEASLSEYAIEKLGVRDGDEVQISHTTPVRSFSHLRSKIYGNTLNETQFNSIIQDIVGGHYSDIHLSSFLTACAGGRLNSQEITYLTKAMVNNGDKLDWGKSFIVDKHCVGGLPGNRTTPIIVSIVAAFGLIMPKTSSRAITSPAGTADSMEVVAPVDLTSAKMRKVVEKEGGCVVWGGSVSLSPADDLMIRIERVLDLDSEGQLVASVLSKKVTAGSSHVLIDIPVGPTAKVRSTQMADELSGFLMQAGSAIGLDVCIHMSDGTQPVGFGIGPALEARDFIAVLKNEKSAPQDLRAHAIDLAGHILEFSHKVQEGDGARLAEDILTSGRAWEKFQAICEAQGGMRDIPKAKYTHMVESNKKGRVQAVDNRSLARLAKLTGAPTDKVAGVDLHVKLGEAIAVGQPLFTLHSASKGELNYALAYLAEQEDMIFKIEDEI